MKIRLKEQKKVNPEGTERHCRKQRKTSRKQKLIYLSNKRRKKEKCINKITKGCSEKGTILSKKKKALEN